MTRRGPRRDMNVVQLPARIARLADRTVRRAVGNAADSAAEITRQRSRRAALTPSQNTEQATPGELVRLSQDESLRLLRTKSIGRFAHVESARVLSVVPVNYVVTPDDVVLFRTGPGPKLDSTRRPDVVAFEVDEIDGAAHSGWSVLVIGHARRLTVVEERQLVDAPQPWANGPRTEIVAITPSRIEGRRLC